MTILNLPKKIISFLKEVKTEIKKINWPTKKEVFRHTIIVLVISIIVAIFLGGLDYIYTLLMEKFVF